MTARVVPLRGRAPPAALETATKAKRKRGLAALPEPLTPPDCNLRGMQFFNLDHHRLFASDFWQIANGDEFKAAFTLWAKSFDQVPGASLPDDDRMLAALSGAGRGWAAVKAMALYGWVKCSDGRLYHPVMAEKALAAMAGRAELRASVAASRERMQKSREKRREMFEAVRAAGMPIAWNATTEQVRQAFNLLKSHEQEALPVARNGSATGAQPAQQVAQPVTAIESQRESQRVESSEELRSSAAPAAAASEEGASRESAPPPAPPTEEMTEDAIKRAFWAEQVPRVMRLMPRSTEAAARRYLGKILSETGMAPAALAPIIARCEAEAPVDPASWIKSRVKALGGTGGPRLAPRDLGADHRERALAAAREIDARRAAERAGSTGQRTILDLKPNGDAR